MAARDDDAGADTVFDEAPVTAPDFRLRGFGAGFLFVFGTSVLAASFIVLILWLVQPPEQGPAPDSRDILGLCLAALTGVLWIFTGVAWWRRGSLATIIGMILALVLGAVAAWLIRY